MLLPKSPDATSVSSCTISFHEHFFYIICPLLSHSPYFLVCYQLLDTGICKVTYQPDNFRSNLLYLPIGAILSIVWLGIGFEIIEPIIRINPLILAALGAPLIYNGSVSITDQFIFPNNKIVYGPCPACENETRVYFGDILGVEGFGDLASVKCTKCKAIINVQKKSLRASTLPKDE